MRLTGIICLFFIVISCATKPDFPTTKTDEITKEASDIDKPKVDLPQVAIKQKESIEQEEPKIQSEEQYVDSFAKNLSNDLKNKSINEVLEDFKAIPEDYKNNSELNYLQVSLLLSAGELDEAEKKGKELEENNKNNPDITVLNALVAQEQGKNQQSVNLINNVLKKYPSHVGANIIRANMYMPVKNFSMANKHYLKALEKEPKNEDALFGYGQTAWYLENIKHADKAFTKLSEINPENDMAWSYRAKLAAEKNDYKKAIEYIEKAIKYAPNYYYHQLNAGSYYLALEQYDKTEQAWTKAISINDSYFLAYAYRGGFYDEQGEYQKAKLDYQKVVKYNPNYFYAHESLALLSWHEQDWETARKEFVEAYKSTKNNLSYALMISATYHKQGKVNENKEFVGKAMRNLDRQSLDYAMLRLYYDGLADSSVLRKVLATESRTTRGKMLFYMALFYELEGIKELANQYYLEVFEMNAPLFFEYRLTQWAIEKLNKDEIQNSAG